MPNITVAVQDAQNTALAAEATARSTDSSTVTATHIATAVVTSHADRIRRDDYMLVQGAGCRWYAANP